MRTDKFLAKFGSFLSWTTVLAAGLVLTGCQQTLTMAPPDYAPAMSRFGNFPAPQHSGALPAEVLEAALTQPEAPAEPMGEILPRWWKGNLHTHSHWSDGDDYPEMIADWYKRNGYNFLSFTDHNAIQQGEKWVNVRESRGKALAFDKYMARFGPSWVETRDNEGELEVRLKAFYEFRSLFDEPGVFLQLQGEEISDRHLTSPIHINANNIRELVPPQGGSSVLDVMQNNVNAVLEQRRRTGQAMFPHINHPNFGWALTGEEMMHVEHARFFEVHNGHPNVHNYGDDTRPGTERMWDIILTWRLAVLGFEPMYGLATDDSHNYHETGPKRSNTGRGWVMVRATHLTPEKIVHAMEAGDFYSSSGVVLRDIRHDETQLTIEIEPEEGVIYTTQFIGTLEDFDRTSEPITNAAGEPLRITHRYSQEIGKILAEVPGTTPSYQFNGDELYVRARIVSSKLQENPYAAGDRESAWTQPIVLKQLQEAPSVVEAGGN